MVKQKKSVSAKGTTATASERGRDKLDAVVVKMQKLMSGCEVDWAKRHHELGCEIRRVQEDPEAYGLQRGDNAVKLLAKKTGYQKDTLYNAVKVATAWGRPEFERELTQHTAKGRPIAFAIFAEVAKLEDPTARAAMLKDVREKSMSSREVRAAVAGDRVKRKGAQQAMASRLTRVVAETERELDAAKCLATSIAQLSGANGAEAARQADRAAELQHQLATVCLNNVKALHKLREALESAMPVQPKSDSQKPPILSASTPLLSGPLLEAGAMSGQRGALVCAEYVDVLVESEAVVSSSAPEFVDEGQEDTEEDEEGVDDEDDDESRDPSDISDVVDEMSLAHVERWGEEDGDSSPLSEDPLLDL
jgi:hypothetical protein